MGSGTSRSGYEKIRDEPVSSPAFSPRRQMAHSVSQSIIKGNRQPKPDVFNRHNSVTGDLQPSLLNDPFHQTRRELYTKIPFVAVQGLTRREGEVLRTASSSNLLKDLQQAAHHEEAAHEVVLTTRLLAATVVAATSQFLVGYNTAVMNAPAAVIFPGHTTLEWAFVVSAFAIGGPIGAVIGGRASNRHGRRGALLADSWCFLVAGLCLALSPSIHALIFARFLVGLASGFASVVIPVYLGEIAPPTMRGSLGTCTQFAMVIGILAADCLAFPLGREGLYWRALLGVTPLLAAAQLLLAPLLCESPRWRLSRNDKCKIARRDLYQLRGFRSLEELEHEVAHILEASKTAATRHASAHSGGAMWDLLTNKKLRLLVSSSVVLHLAQQFCGINAVFYYSTMFFSGVVANPDVATAVTAFVNVIATYVALRLMDLLGRRTLILWSVAGMTVCCVVITLALLGLAPNYLALFGVLGYVSFFEIGLGPVPWLFPAEVFDAKYVATAMSIGCQLNWASNFVVGVGFPFLASALGSWVFAPFGCVLFVVYVFFYAYMPETADKTPAEILREIEGMDNSDYRTFSYEVVGAVQDVGDGIQRRRSSTSDSIVEEATLMI